MQKITITLSEEDAGRLEKATGLPAAKAVKELVKKELESNRILSSDSNRAKIMFELARKKYPWTKRGCDTEFDSFKKHKDFIDVVPLLEPAIIKQIEYHKYCIDHGVYTPMWQNFRTWITQRSWEIEIPVIAKKPTVEESNKAFEKFKELEKTLFKQVNWHNYIIRNSEYQITMNQLLNHLQLFFSEMGMKTDIYRNELECKKYFINWLNRRLANRAALKTYPGE